MADGMGVADVLERAADLIEPEGAWQKGDYSDKGDPLSDLATCWCVLGAIRRAGEFKDDTNPATGAFGRLLGVAWIHEWNDAPERTQPEVVAKLREAAALARSEASS